MSKQTRFRCKIIDSENWELGGKEDVFEIITPFGKCGSHNNPEDRMIMRWLHKSGATYVFEHTDIHEWEDNKNEASISTKCGQKMEIELIKLDEDQEIDEVIIRGVKYVRE